MGERRDKKRLATAEEAVRRIAELRRVYDQGFLPKDIFEAMTRDIKSRVQDAREEAGRPRSDSA